MGWLFSSRWQTKQELVDHLKHNFDTGTLKYLDECAVVGNVAYFACESHLDPAHPVKLVVVCLLASDTRKGNGWGYKDMDETMGPYYYSCPLRLLDLTAPGPGGRESQAWRERVRAFHAGKRAAGGKAKANLERIRAGEPFWIPGTTIRTPFRFVAEGRGRSITAEAAGRNYRVGPTHLARAVFEALPPVE